MQHSNLKVSAQHLQRKALLYVRQSTIRQVFEHGESTKRQYALRQRAIALGWSQDLIQIIDCDLGQSGTTSADREGFQQLVTEVGLGRAGIVMGLEVSRLARNSADWHRLIEICALTDTLILDEDGVYDASHFNDRLLLGLKGTMSEAEIHMLRTRLRGGLLNKARRGELRIPLPVGLVYDANNHVVLDPDTQVQESVHLLFKTFFRVGTGHGTVRYFRREGLRFPLRHLRGLEKGKLVWRHLGIARALSLLHNPRYAGAFAYGRHDCRKQADGHMTQTLLPHEQWQVLLRDAHPGYITWEQYENIQQRLQQNSIDYGCNHHHGPPREGPALLQGLVVCGVCGNRMSVYYRQRYGTLAPNYLCNRLYMYDGSPVCQTIPGADIDAAIGTLLTKAMTPMAIEVALAVQEKIRARLDETDRLRRQDVERATYEVECARSRYMHVDPANRLVAGSLEADWNDKLRALEKARDEYERHRESDREALGKAQQERLFSLVNGFPAIWNDPETPQRERKRMVRLLIEDVTLVKHDEITVHVRFRGGATTTLKVPLPLNAWQGRKTPEGHIALIDKLLNSHTDTEVATMLNDQGYITGAGDPFSLESLHWVRQRYGLKSYKERLREKGMLTSREIAVQFGVTISSVNDWRRKGLLRGCQCNDKGEYLYHPLDVQLLSRKSVGKNAIRRATIRKSSQIRYEV